MQRWLNSAAKQGLVLITASEMLVNFNFELVTKATKGWKTQQIVAIIVGNNDFIRQ